MTNWIIINNIEFVHIYVCTPVNTVMLKLLLQAAKSDNRLHQIGFAAQVLPNPKNWVTQIFLKLKIRFWLPTHLVFLV